MTVSTPDIQALIERLGEMAKAEFAYGSTANWRTLESAAAALSALSGETEVTTADELDALPTGSVVLVHDNRAGDTSAWQLFDDVLELVDANGEKALFAWASPAYKSEHPSADLVDFAGSTPIRVLHRPQVTK